MAVAQKVMGFAFVELEEVHDVAQTVAGKSFPPEACVLEGNGQRRAVFPKIRALMPRGVFHTGQERHCVVMFIEYLSETLQSQLPDGGANTRSRFCKR